MAKFYSFLHPAAGIIASKFHSARPDFFPQYNNTRGNKITNYISVTHERVDLHQQTMDPQDLQQKDYAHVFLDPALKNQGPSSMAPAKERCSWSTCSEDEDDGRGDGGEDETPEPSSTAVSTSSQAEEKLQGLPAWNRTEFFAIMTAVERSAWGGTDPIPLTKALLQEGEGRGPARRGEVGGEVPAQNFWAEKEADIFQDCFDPRSEPQQIAFTDSVLDVAFDGVGCFWQQEPGVAAQQAAVVPQYWRNTSRCSGKPNPVDRAVRVTAAGSSRHPVFYAAFSPSPAPPTRSSPDEERGPTRSARLDEDTAWRWTSKLTEETDGADSANGTAPVEGKKKRGARRGRKKSFPTVQSEC